MLSGEKGLGEFHAVRIVGTEKKKKEMAKERTKKQLRVVKRKLEFGEMVGKHTLGNHEWREPLKHGFPTLLIRRSVRSKFEQVVWAECVSR